MDRKEASHFPNKINETKREKLLLREGQERKFLVLFNSLEIKEDRVSQFLLSQELIICLK